MGDFPEWLREKRERNERESILPYFLSLRNSCIIRIFPGNSALLLRGLPSEGLSHLGGCPRGGGGAPKSVSLKNPLHFRNRFFTGLDRIQKSVKE
jgi:hypothetical protein